MKITILHQDGETITPDPSNILLEFSNICWRMSNVKKTTSKIIIENAFGMSKNTFFAMTSDDGHVLEAGHMCIRSSYFQIFYCENKKYLNDRLKLSGVFSLTDYNEMKTEYDNNEYFTLDFIDRVNNSMPPLPVIPF